MAINGNVSVTEVLFPGTSRVNEQTWELVELANIDV